MISNCDLGFRVSNPAAKNWTEKTGKERRWTKREKNDKIVKVMSLLLLIVTAVMSSYRGTAVIVNERGARARALGSDWRY